MNKIIISCLLAGCYPSTSNNPYPVSQPADAGIVIMDATPGPALWSDANGVLAKAFCDLEARCGYDLYAFSYGSGSAADAACYQLEFDSLCYREWEGFSQCNGLYPTKHLLDLAECPGDSGSADCFTAWDEEEWVLSCNIASPWSQ
jgi:hypothetical protein